MTVKRDLLRPKEAELLLAVSQKTLRRWDAEGKIRTVRNGRGHRRYVAADVERIRRTALGEEC